MVVDTYMRKNHICYKYSVPDQQTIMWQAKSSASPCSAASGTCESNPYIRFNLNLYYTNIVMAYVHVPKDGR